MHLAYISFFLTTAVLCTLDSHFPDTHDTADSHTQYPLYNKNSFREDTHSDRSESFASSFNSHGSLNDYILFTDSMPAPCYLTDEIANLTNTIDTLQTALSSAIQEGSMLFVKEEKSLRRLLYYTKELSLSVNVVCGSNIMHTLQAITINDYHVDRLTKVQFGCYTLFKQVEVVQKDYYLKIKRAIVQWEGMFNAAIQVDKDDENLDEYIQAKKAFMVPYYTLYQKRHDMSEVMKKVLLDIVYTTVPTELLSKWRKF